MFKKILIANRGEIAVRIIRTCRELGFRTVAVFSDVDRPSPHVRFADEAWPLDGNSSEETYLRIDKLIDIGKQSGADAVHPGYGFLAENAEFAEAVIESGMTFIGPTPDNLRLAGDKAATRKAMIQAGVPVVPGTEEATDDEGELVAAAEKIGLPILIKAAGGGGGKGIRVVHENEELAPSLARAMSEAKSAFGRGEVYLEKFLDGIRHIEVQLLGDQHGKVIHLGERECSIQRRHQKLVEESPSPFVSPELREALGRAAVHGAEAIEYQNAGTMEFLVEPEGTFHFIEINARLQVEHPITECLTGLDLVAEQIRIAAGEKLALSQIQVELNGHAIECRIYAEDWANNFMPSPGTISEWLTPGGRGVRIDSAAFAGWKVPVYYDPLIAKLIVSSPSREESLRRLTSALSEFRAGGIHTTIPFFMRLIEEESFLNGDFDTGFVERWLPDSVPSESGIDGRILAAAAALARMNSISAPGVAGSSTSARRSELSTWQKALAQEQST